MVLEKNKVCVCWFDLFSKKENVLVSHRWSVTRAIWRWFSVTNLNIPNLYLLTFLNGSPYIIVILNYKHPFCLFLSIQKPGLQPLSFTFMCHSFPWGPYCQVPNADLRHVLRGKKPQSVMDVDITTWLWSPAQLTLFQVREMAPIPAYVLPILSSEVLKFFRSTGSTIWWAVFLQGRH